MRIGFTGSQGTGKTTLAKEMVRQWPEYVYVPSTARAAAAAGLLINRDADPLSQILTTVSRCTEEDRLYRQSAGNVISDRTPLDSLAYTIYQNETVWKKTPFNPDFYMDLTYKFVREHMYKYDIVYYFPIYWGPKGDGIRDPDAQYQQDIDEYVQSMLSSMKVQHLVMPKGSTQDRFVFVEESLKSIA